MKHPRFPLRILALFLFALAGTQLTHAQDNWIGVAGVSATTNWSDNLNWSTGLAPTASDAVVFSNDVANATAGVIDNVVDTSTTVATHTNAPDRVIGCVFVRRWARPFGRLDGVRARES